MSTLFRRPSNISCFFCQEAITPQPRDPRSFRCPHCACWNRYDAKGEIMSDEPAMHDEMLNSRSFAKRASPSKDRLPTMYGVNRDIFCHTCQTNQMLLTNLLSNYLPPPEHPEYNHRLEMLPDYRGSLHVRYPPVCENCLPAVEEEIRSKDHMARTKALGGWLRQSKGKEKQRKVSAPGKDREKLGVQLAVWRIRGCLWALSLLSAIGGNCTAAFGYSPPHQLTHYRPILPVIALVSIFWSAWDPTYSAFRKAQIQGRDVRVQGKTTYIVLQMLSWLSRLVTSVFLAIPCFRPHHDYLNLSQGSTLYRSRIYFSVSLALELFIILGSYFVLRLQLPPAIRLLDTTTYKFPSDLNSVPSESTSVRSSPAPRASAEPDLLSTLSLSSKPIVTPASHPIFGLPSLLPANAATSTTHTLPHNRMDYDDNNNRDADEMDWTPTDPLVASKHHNKRKALADNDDGSWLRPQKFFPPEQPTGLEGLFARTMLMDDKDNHSPTQNEATRHRKLGRNWWYVWGLLIVPLLGIAYKLWRWDITFTRTESATFIRQTSSVDNIELL